MSATVFNHYTVSVLAGFWLVGLWGDPTPDDWRPNALPLLLAQAAGYGGA